jgi:hypothetical protein
MNTTHLTAKSLTVGAPEIGAPRLGQVHVLQAATGVHHLKATLKQARNRVKFMIELIQTALREQVPEWRERFPTPEEMPNKKLQVKGRIALTRDPRTAPLEWKRIRKSFMRAVGREKLR